MMGRTRAVRGTRSREPSRALIKRVSRLGPPASIAFALVQRSKSPWVFNAFCREADWDRDLS